MSAPDEAPQGMKTIRDCFGHGVRLTDERMAHILEHTERELRRHRLSHRQTKNRRHIMADKLKVWFDAEADYLEVRFSEAAGYEKETNHDAVMERVDLQGQVIGFSILGVSQFRKDHPLEVDLISA